eukprot:2884318-Prymnesium_polylepis.1
MRDTATISEIHPKHGQKAAAHAENAREMLCINGRTMKWLAAQCYVDVGESNLAAIQIKCDTCREEQSCSPTFWHACDSSI